ncbi:MAG: hypothetical protein A2788_00800 [Candidatus Abawacabacteria bacterium RIFCSPHIGHO2_01_FULL_46_8]|uniref:V-type ATP synthase subunit D n=1 Tax=Candidatus Abawacabacteria bacterium RIFCSPHIGHO2_01_FULL_46_8 TaxID=1817815 RepID=A0A1F4XHP9_9BACT|nr:MAG: hypothetical protein A2788_00800 [Candidatus Abawacabacteria bacterium RIFCSPHIGHO2_01_FULL_46_8]
MAILTAYNPTKMALLELKRRHKQAKRGHKLLKDKQEGLMKAFMAIIRNAQALRKEVEEKLGDIFESFLFASASEVHPEFIEAAFLVPAMQVKLTTVTKNVMSVKLADMTAEMKGDPIAYGFYQTPAELDIALIKLRDAFPLLVKLAEVEKKAERMAEELEKTRRRVNALEHITLPNVQDTIKYIGQILGESARMQVVIAMIVKAKE